MRRSWPLLLSLSVTGGVAGTAIAGLPQPDTGTVVILDPASVTNDSTDSPQVITTDATGQVVVQTTIDGATTTALVASDAPPVAPVDAAAITTVAGGPPAGAGDQDADPVAAAAGLDLAPDPTATTILSTTLPPDELLDRSVIRLVIANGDNRTDLAQSNGNRLLVAGYRQISVVIEPEDVTATVLYYRPGFANEAGMVSADMLVPGAVLMPLPPQGVTAHDDLGDIVVVVGPDAVP